MIGATVVSPAYRHLEKESVSRFKKSTGITEVEVVRCRDKDGFNPKLNLDKLFGRKKIVFFDVDWWAVQPIPRHLFESGTWGGVQDSAVWNPKAYPGIDCGLFKLDKTRYINSGFMSFDLSNPLHRKVFQLARRLSVKKGGKAVDPTDQGYLNVALQRLNVPQTMWPMSFNFYVLAAVWGQVPYIPRVLHGIHAAGFPLKHKKHALQAQAAIFDMVPAPMCIEAVKFHHACQFELA